MFGIFVENGLDLCLKWFGFVSKMVCIVAANPTLGWWLCSVTQPQTLNRGMRGELGCTNCQMKNNVENDAKNKLSKNKHKKLLNQKQP